MDRASMFQFYTLVDSLFDEIESDDEATAAEHRENREALAAGWGCSDLIEKLETRMRKHVAERTE